MSSLVARVVTLLYCQKLNESYLGSLDYAVTAVEVIVVLKVTTYLSF